MNHKAVRTPFELARKRARDRKAQQAMRDRARNQVEILNAQVAHLSQRLQAQELEIEQIRVDSEDIVNIRTENEYLKAQLAQIGRLASLDSETISYPFGPCSGRIACHPSICESWIKRSPRVELSHLTSMPDATSSTASFVVSEPPGLPLNGPPTCPADRIMQPFVEEKRRLVCYFFGDSGASRPNPEASAFHQAIRYSISRVAADLLGTYGQIETIPKRVACMFTISSVLNWLIFQTKESFEQMPLWLRPCPAQFEIPHPAWIDRVPWPRVRDYLVHHQDIDFDKYTDAFTIAFHVNWPYDDRHVIGVDESVGLAAAYHWINPTFEEHIRNLRNWHVGPQYSQQYPALGKALEQDIHEFGSFPFYICSGQEPSP